MCGPRRAWREGAVGRAGAGAAREGEAWLGTAAVHETDKPEGGLCCDAGKREASPVPATESRGYEDNASVLRRAAGSSAGA